MNNLYKIFIVVTAINIAALPFSLTYAADTAGKPVKQVSCKQEAKQKGIKDKADKKAYIKQCEEKRKAAHSK